MNNEALVILQEECAEVIQAISKIQRFGLDSASPTDIKNRDALVQEIGDVLALVTYLIDSRFISHDEIKVAKVKKWKKLKEYSSL